MKDLVTYDPQPALSGLVQAISARWSDFNLPKVTTLEELGLADSTLSELKKQQKALTQFEKEALSPLKEMTLKVKEYFSGPAQKLASVESALKAAILEYHRAEEAKRRAQELELQRQAEAEAEKARERLRTEAAEAALFGDGEEAILEAARAIDTPIIRVPEIKLSGGASSTRKVRKWRVIDSAKVPAQYWVLNEALIGKECRAGYVAPPGIEFYEEETLSVRTGA